MGLERHSASSSNPMALSRHVTPRLRRTLVWLRASLLGQFVLAILHFLAEFESKILFPPQTPWLRLLHLKLSGVECSRPLFIGTGFMLYCSSSIRLGRRICIGERCGIYAHAAIEIGDDFLAAPGFTINSGDHDPATLIPRCEPIVIGKRVWCGSNVTILSGVKIGDDCVIGAGAVVRQDVPPNTIALGVPAKPIKRELRSTEKIWSCYRV